MWGAINPETGVSYLYHEYYRSQAEPVIHAAASRRSENGYRAWRIRPVSGLRRSTGAVRWRCSPTWDSTLQPAVNAVRDLRSRLLPHFGQIVAACCGLGFSWEGFSRETRVASMPQPARMAKLVEGPQW